MSKLLNIKTLLVLCLLLPAYSHAIEKCELPLKFLSDANDHLKNNDLPQGRYNFSVYFDLHKLLMHECADEQYTLTMTNLLDQYGDARHKFNAD